MTDSINGLIERLRAIDHTSVEDCFLQSPCFSKAADLIEAQKAEIERLKAGGCARDQRTTQWCAEAVELQKRLAYAIACMQRIHACVDNPDFAFKRAVILVDVKYTLEQLEAK